MSLLCRKAGSIKRPAKKKSQPAEHSRMYPFIKINSIKPWYFRYIFSRHAGKNQHNKKPGNAWQKFFYRNFLHLISKRFKQPLSCMLLHPSVYLHRQRCPLSFLSSSHHHMDLNLLFPVPILKLGSIL